MSTELCQDLPQECWELIISRLEDPHHFDSLSRVSHRFLSLTNYLRRSFTITPPNLQSLPSLFNRFPNLTALTLPQFCRNLDDVLSRIAESNLKLTRLNISKQSAFPLLGIRKLGNLENLKVLCCFNVNCLKDCDLFAIGNSFPGLEELDIGYPDSGFVTDDGVLELSMRLKNLKKINLSGNHFITDKSLSALASSCFLLRELLIVDCDFITQKGVALFMRHCRSLESFLVNSIGIPSIDEVLIKSFTHARRLCELHVSDSYIANELLGLIGEFCLPLKRLNLSHSYGFTLEGISLLLSNNQSIVCLNLEGANFLSDESMLELCKFLPSLRSINLNSCSKLTSESFFTLTRECSLLCEIHMERTNLGVEFCATEFVQNDQVKRLYLANNNNLSDESIQKIGTICPNVEILDVQHCLGITGEGIEETLKSFQRIRHLEINWCRGIDSFKIGIDLPNMEVIRAKGTGMNDDALAAIRKNCPRLLHLDLQGCSKVTNKGVTKVVDNCKLLREINLKGCDKVSTSLVTGMVFARRSLRKIIPPGSFIPTENQRNFFLLHGCLVCDG